MNHSLSLSLSLSGPLDRVRVDALLQHLPQRAHLAKLGYVLHGLGDGEVHLLLGGESEFREEREHKKQIMLGTHFEGPRGNALQ